MNSFRQIKTVTWMNLRNVPQRFASSLVVVFGNAGVVAVLVSVLAMAAGFSRTINDTGRADRVIVMRGGANSELTSILTRDAAKTIGQAPGIAHDSSGAPVGSADIVVTVDLAQKSDGSRNGVTLRGVGPQAFELRPEIQIVDGRLFEPGKNEIIVGHAAMTQFKGLNIGERIAFGDNEWTVVGTFSSKGSSQESEILGDAETVIAAFRRNSFNSVTVLLKDAAAFKTFKDALTSDPSLSVEVERETDYLAAVSEKLNKELSFTGLLVGTIMSIGGIFGALNTMYAAVSRRRMEIAVLRAIGFDSISVVVSVIVEAILLALAGGALGALLSRSFFNGNVVNTIGGNSSQVIFHLTVTPGLILLGILLAIGIGLIGGLVPAARTARMRVADALRGL